MQVMHWCDVLIVLDTPFFIMVSVPVGGLNLIVVPEVTVAVPKAEVPNREVLAAGVWPNRLVLCGCPNRLVPAAGVVEAKEPNCGRGWPKEAAGVPKIPVPAAGCWFTAPNMDVLAVGAPNPKEGAVDVAG